MKAVAKKILDHLYGPVGSIIVHCLIIFALYKLVDFAVKEKDAEVEVLIMEPDAVDLEEFEKEIEELEPPEDVVQIDAPSLDVEMEQPPDIADATPEPDVEFNAMDIQQINSPLVMRGLYAGRSAGGRASALRKHGGRWGELTEKAVNRALQWLKKNQNSDGSWSVGNKGPSAKKMETGVSGLALLAFLAHGETPQSDEYGSTVEKTIRFLISRQQDDGRFFEKPDVINQSYKAGTYSQAIATYALSEAYGLTKIPMLREPLEKSLRFIIKQQQEKGAWYYAYSPVKWNMSVSAWHVQALKAAYIGGIRVEGQKEALDKAIKWIKSMHNSESGFFYYTMPNKQPRSEQLEGVTGCAVLCMQLTGHGKESEARQGMNALKNAKCDFDKPYSWSMTAWYYVTQAKFHKGGSTWDAWNNEFAKEFIEQQNNDGSWTSPAKRGSSVPWGVEYPFGPAYSTSLAALTLMVYYRHLPTYQHVDEEPEPVEMLEDDDDIEIEII